MAKKATKKKSGGAKPRKRSGTTRSQAGEAFVSLLQSPLVADLVAVAATTALATLAEHGFSNRGAGGGTRRTGRAVKAAGKAAAAAVGRRLSDEIEEIKKASKASKPSKAAKGGAKG